jgi:GST-like protein
MACYPWIVPHEAHGQRLEDFPNLARWFATVGARPATVRVYEGVANTYAPSKPLSEEERKVLFGQAARR